MADDDKPTFEISGEKPASPGGPAAAVPHSPPTLSSLLGLLYLSPRLKKTRNLLRKGKFLKGMFDDLQFSTE